MPPDAAWLTDSKLRAPGTSDQNAASIITTAGGEVLIRAASIANGTTRIAPTNPEWDAVMSLPASACPTRATAIAAISHSSDPRGADR